MKKLIFAFLILMSSSSFSQELFFFGCNSTDFPIVKANFELFDVNGNRIENISKDDVVLIEDGKARNILNVTCPPNEPPKLVSIAMSIDVSGSMSVKLGEEQAVNLCKYTALGLCKSINLPKAEFALQICDDYAMILQDFTTDVDKIISKIPDIYAAGNNDFVEHLLNPLTGLLNIAKNGKNEKFAILFTDAYWGALHENTVEECIEICNQNKIKFFAVLYSHQDIQSSGIQKSLQEICDNTGGKLYDGITTSEASAKLAEIISSQIRNGSKPCDIEWESDNACGFSNRIVKLSVPSLKKTTSSDYNLPFYAISSLDFSPKYVHFKNCIAGQVYDTTIKVTAINYAHQNIDITSDDPAFSATPKTFSINKNESVDVNITYLPIDNKYHYSNLEFISDKCNFNLRICGSNDFQKPSKSSLVVKHPNGGEKIYIGSDTLIKWDGLLPNDTVKIDYSINNGLDWSLITNSASNLEYTWKKIPSPESDQCLVKITQMVDSSDTYKPGDFITDLASLGIPVYNWQYIYNPIIWSSDSKNCALINDEFNLTICDPISGDVLEKIINTNYKTNKIAWHSKINMIAADDNDGRIRVWDPSSGTLINKLEIPYASIDFETWHPFDNVLAAIGYDGKIYIINVINNRVDLLISGNGFTYKNAVFSPEGDCIAASTSKGDLLILDSQNGNVLHTFTTNALLGKINKPSWSPNGKYISAPTSTNGLSVWDYEKKEFLNIIYGKNGHGEWSYNSEFIAMVSAIGEVKIFKPDNNIEILTFDNKKHIVQNISWNPKALKLVTTQDSLAVIWDVENATSTDTLFLNRTKYFHQATWSPDGTKIGTLSLDSIAKIWFGANILMEFQSDTSDKIFSIVASRVNSKDVDMGKCLISSSKDSLCSQYLINNNPYEIEVDTIYISGKDASAFTINSGDTRLLIEPNNSRSFEFRFKPTFVGIHQANVVIITKSDTLINNIIGEGVKPIIEIQKGVLDFGAVLIGDEKVFQDTILIKNISTESIAIEDVLIIGPDTMQFKILNGAGSFILQPNAYRKMSISFKPQLGGRTSSKLFFKLLTDNTPSIVPLYGIGIGGLTIKVADDSAYAGAFRNLSLKLVGANIKDLNPNIKNYSAKIRFNKYILSPVKKSDRVIINDSVYVTINGKISKNDLARIPVIAGLGLVESTKVEILKFEFKDELNNVIEYDIDTLHGTFKLLGICREGGTRLINPTGKAEILSIMPNPASEDIEINMKLIEDGATIVSIFNSNGMKIQEYNIIGETGQKSIKLNAKNFSNGLYFIQLQTPTVIENQKLMIIK